MISWFQIDVHFGKGGCSTTGRLQRRYLFNVLRPSCLRLPHTTCTTRNLVRGMGQARRGLGAQSLVRNVAGCVLLFCGRVILLQIVHRVLEFKTQSGYRQIICDCWCNSETSVDSQQHVHGSWL